MQDFNRLWKYSQAYHARMVSKRDLSYICKICVKCDYDPTFCSGALKDVKVTGASKA